MRQEKRGKEEEGERTRSQAPTFSFRLFSFPLCYEFYSHTADRGTCGAGASDCIVGVSLVLSCANIKRGIVSCSSVGPTVVLKKRSQRPTLSSRVPKP